MGSKKTKVFLVAFGVLLLTLVGSGLFFTQLYLTTPASSMGSEVIYEVHPSMPFNSVAEDLQKLGVINNPKLFSIFARVRGLRSGLKVGEYALNTNMVPGQVLAVITSGKSRTRPFLVPEGFNIFEIADQFEKQGFGHRDEFLALAMDKGFVKSLLGEDYDSFEGYLFPETYQLSKFMTAKDAITAMVRRFQNVYMEVTQQYQLGVFNRHQFITLASIIEKETGAPEERRVISSVFHNRLNQKMRLQTDPTVIYGMAVADGKVPLNIRKEDLLKPTKYNTYVNYGLPIGPISNPGREAMIAALDPQKTEFLYFVSQNNGTHVFTKTYQDHTNAVRRFQMDPRAREGRSWRNLENTEKKDP